MRDLNPYRHCQYPNAARKAAMVSSSAVMPIEFIIDPNLQELQYNVEPYKIYTKTVPVPPKILRDLTCKASVSLNEILHKAVKSPELDEASPLLAESFAQAKGSLAAIIQAGLEDKPISEEAVNDLNRSAQFLRNWQNDPQIQPVTLLGIPVSNIIPAVADKLTEVANQILIDSSRSQGPQR